VSREPTLDELIGGEGSSDERQQLQKVHEQLLQAGPPPELTEKLESGPTLGMTLGERRRIKRRAMLLIAAALATVLVFLAGYAVANRGGKVKHAVISQALAGTSLVPQAQGALQVWDSKDGANWPMTLTVVGLPAQSSYEVYLVRNGKPWGLCGTFRVGTSPANPVTVTLTAPYSLEQGDKWVVTRPGKGGAEPGQTVLQPTTA
jgi:hypothetical protein